MNKFHIEFGSDIDTKANSNYIKQNININWLKNAYFFRSARDGLKYIAKQKNNISKNIFIPIFSCSSMAEPFKINGFNIIFYPLNNDYGIKFDFINNRIANNDIILVSNYLGLKNDNTEKSEDLFLQNLKNKFKNIIIIKDYTQSLEQVLYTKKEQDDFYIFSSRKWAGFPDGGILWSKEELDIKYDVYDSTYFELKKKAIDLKSEYLETEQIEKKQEFLNLFKKADIILEEDNNIIEMSNYSKELIKKIDFEGILKTRKRHIKYLEDNTPFIKNLSSNTNCSGQYFPIYVEKQKEFQKYMAQNNIYCPIIWPIIEDNKNSDFDFCNNLIKHMLAVPCDQRYSYQELDFIINKMKNFK